MSFILDALKKSEERRQQSETTPQVRQRVMSVSTTSMSRRVMLVVFLVVPLALVAGWWLRGTTEKPSVQQNLPVDAEPVLDAERPASPVVDKEPVTMPDTEPNSAAEIETVAVKRMSEPDLSLPQQGEPQETKPLLLYRDLPPALREQMPPLTLSMHFFADDPQRRLVRVNGQLLHEGDSLAGDIDIVEIIETGIVLDFTGLQFVLKRSGL